MEVDYNEDKEMVDGVVELLLQVKDLENRKEIVKQIIRDFALEGVSYDYDDFLNRVGLTDFGFDFPSGTCWEGYEPYGTKIVDGREVPNCVPVKASIDTTGMKPYQTPNGDDLLKKKEMGMIGYDGGVPIYADEYEARAAATALGCSGAHQMDGAWAPCDNHEDAVKGVEATDLVVNKLKKMLELLGGKPL
jgi:hypothetical protein